MRLSKSFGKTLREAPADAEMISHQLLIRANFVRPTGAGIYSFMPLGYRVLRKIWQIMAEEFFMLFVSLSQLIIIRSGRHPIFLP